VDAHHHRRRDRPRRRGSGCSLRRFPGSASCPATIALERTNVRFYFPLTTRLLISALLTTVAWLIKHFTR
jgi:hypothetical protein